MSTESYKIHIIGCHDTGRMQMLVRQDSGRFVTQYACSCCAPQHEDSHRIPFTIDGKEKNLDIVFSTYREDYSALRDQYTKSADGYILCYSIASSSSFTDMEMLEREIFLIRDIDYGTRLPIVLCGNKCDLEKNRQVSTEEGKALAQKYNIGFFETSAKENINITEVFEYVVREIMFFNKESIIQQQQEEER